MAKTTLQESIDTRAGGVHGLVWGAVLGALIIGALAIILDVLGVAHGGVVLSMAAGAGLGGLAGLMYGALSVRRSATSAR
jgi:hypothetical protein